MHLFNVRKRYAVHEKSGAQLSSPLPLHRRYLIGVVHRDGAYVLIAGALGSNQYSPDCTGNIVHAVHFAFSMSASFSSCRRGSKAEANFASLKLPKRSATGGATVMVLRFRTRDEFNLTFLERFTSGAQKPLGSAAFRRPDNRFL